MGSPHRVGAGPPEEHAPSRSSQPCSRVRLCGAGEGSTHMCVAGGHRPCVGKAGVRWERGAGGKGGRGQMGGTSVILSAIEIFKND